MSRLTLLALALLFGTPGCMTPAPTRHVAGRSVDVRAARLDLALRFATEADRALEWMRSICPGTRDERPEIWVVDRIAPWRAFPLGKATDGLHLDFLWIDRIYLSEDAERGAVAHELGHCLLGADWNRLPPFMEEGLCNWFQTRQPGMERDGERRRLLRVTAALALGGELELRLDGSAAAENASTRIRFSSTLPGLDRIARHSSSALVLEDSEQRLTAHAHGYVLVERVVERVGLEGLIALCRRASREQRARVPLDWLYAAAGIEGSESMGRELLLAMQPEELTIMARSLTDPILRFLSKERGLARGSPDFERWLRAADPVLAIPGTELALELMNVDGVGEALAAARARAAVRLPQGDRVSSTEAQRKPLP